MRRWLDWLRWPRPQQAPRRTRQAVSLPDAPAFVTIQVGTPLAQVEQLMLEETLRLTKGNRTLTARMLGIDPKTVYRKLREKSLPGTRPRTRAP